MQYHFIPTVYNGKIVLGDDTPRMSPSLSEGNGEEAQIQDSIMLQEQGIYSLLQAESANQVLLSYYSNNYDS